MDEKRILEKLDEYSVLDGEKRLLSCALAHQIAKELDVELEVVGKLCNREKIKLSSCQLGCFDEKGVKGPGIVKE